MSGESVVGPWAETKLSYLADYLAAYTTILKGQTHWCKNYMYVDAFAGPGKHRIRSTGTETSSGFLDTFSEVDELVADYIADAEQALIIDGSPRRALSIRHPFTKYLFIEKSESRAAKLRELTHEFPHCSIEIERASCVDVLSSFLRQHDWRRERAFVFLDPFGMQVHWDLIASLAQTEAIEILLNFPVGMAINRLLNRNASKLSRTMLDQYFGTNEWFDAMYKKKQSYNLFDDQWETEIEKVHDSGRKLVQWYRQRLLSIFPFVSKAGLIRNSRNCPLYYLIHATPNKVAKRIMDHILSSDEVVE